MKNTTIFFILYLLLFQIDNSFAQTTNDSITIIGSWKMQTMKMEWNDKNENWKKKANYQFNSNSTFNYKDNKYTYTGKWKILDSMLQLSYSDGTDGQIKIFKLSQSELILYTEDGPAKFYHIYKRKKIVQNKTSGCC